MDRSPAGESDQRVPVFQDQVVGNGEDLPVGLGEAGLEILHDSRLLPDAVEEVGGAKKASGSPGNGHRPSLGFLSPAAGECFSLFGGNNLLGLRVNPADALALCPRLLLVLVPIRDRLIHVDNPGFFIDLVYDSSHIRFPLSSLQRIHYNDAQCKENRTYLFSY